MLRPGSGRSAHPISKGACVSKKTKLMARIRDGELVVETLVQWAARYNKTRALAPPKGAKK